MLDNIETLQIVKPLDSRTIDYHRKQMELAINSKVVAEPFKTPVSTLDRITQALKDIEAINVEMFTGGAHNVRSRTSKY